VLAVEGSTGASCLRPPNGWTSRESWPSGRQIPTRRRPPGTRSRIPPTLRRKEGETSSISRA